MTHTVIAHSYRSGTGKSTLIANLATLLAIEGKRVGLVDFNFKTPSLHIFFNLLEADFAPNLNHYLWGECDTIAQSFHDLTPRLRIGTNMKGSLWFASASPNSQAITRMKQGGYYWAIFKDAFQAITKELALDYLFIDTQHGFNEETVATIGYSDTLFITLHADQQGYEGTIMILNKAKTLKVPSIHLVVNQVPKSFLTDRVRKQFMSDYMVKAVTILPFTSEVTVMVSRGIFVLYNPTHPLTAVFKNIARQLSQDTS